MRLLFSSFLSCGLVLQLVGTLTAADPVELPDLVYASPSGTELRLDFVRPSGDGPFPVVICIHGGGWQFGSRKEYRDLQLNFAKMGIASASVQYRFAPKHRFPAPLDDVRSAMEHLRDSAATLRISPQQMAVLGGSAGGHLALLVAANPPKGITVRAVLNFAGPTDLARFRATPNGDRALKQAIQRDSADLLSDLLGTTDRTAAIYRDASPLAQLTAKMPPVFTIHGKADDIVPFEQAELLHAELKRLGVKQQLFPIPNGNHDVASWSETSRVLSIVAGMEFLKQQLRMIADNPSREVGTSR
ncbi:alpha/beta hydrolase [Tuwongella immobilis]|uniref:BD-FAE-like domain-containing protein n=1 Tax=Tuwongella immobilis TaxID=692036 RepID=A0A6C2YNC7_9BACT|nr:alpha/beta hydrolase [Tuwongella immobilis]VIP02565.1 alpha beta hydrolase : Uncharacterized protein OS=Niastella koreensis (strain DSM 17620 / KACC 11465 / GR20-10) GN=Niako_5221 PE=4 SV=1: Abhydrolase_3 [Tuwongella immobilis]VTS01784.1 alpha beta hydrolase : Uncharacterized protein OS=Niastella koreensis (strain DSM 17620 / KACC 11465 / GR20-10) GN=Niako_5221 PE=4 SV=1: Abhydrolase_3 [Tuwongella immobilis]